MYSVPRPQIPFVTPTRVTAPHDTSDVLPTTTGRISTVDKLCSIAILVISISLLHDKSWHRMVKRMHYGKHIWVFLGHWRYQSTVDGIMLLKICYRVSILPYHDIQQNIRAAFVFVCAYLKIAMKFVSYLSNSGTKFRALAWFFIGCLSGFEIWRPV